MPFLGRADIPDTGKAARNACALFLSCRWSKMTYLDFQMIHHAIGMVYRPEDDPPKGIKHIYSSVVHLMDFLGRISKRRSYSLERYPPIYSNSDQQTVYTLSKPPAKAAYNGLSLTAYEKLMEVMMMEEMYEAK